MGRLRGLFVDVPAKEPVKGDGILPAQFTEMGAYLLSKEPPSPGDFGSVSGQEVGDLRRLWDRTDHLMRSDDLGVNICGGKFHLPSLSAGAAPLLLWFPV